MACNDELKNTGGSCREYFGSNNGLIFAKTREELATKTTAEVFASYDALIKAGTIFPLVFPNYELVDNENISVDNTFTGSIILYQKGGKDVFMLPNPNDWDNYNLLLGLNQNAILYCWRIYELNAIIGCFDVATRTKFVMEKVSVKKYWKKATATTPKYLCFEVESLEPEYADQFSHTVEPTDFRANDLTGLVDLQIVDSSSEVGVVKVKVYPKASLSTSILDLIITDFIVKIAGVETAPTSMALVGEEYQLTNVAYIAGDVTVELATPTVMDKLYKFYGDPITITLA